MWKSVVKIVFIMIQREPTDRVVVVLIGVILKVRLTTMDKLTDSEIVKALEEILEIMLCEGDLQKSSTISKAIKLINRLQVRVEKFEKVEHFADKTIATLQAENERLKESLNIELENFATEYDNKIKAEAYKEFAARLKTEYAKGMSWFKKKESYYVDVSDIDNLAKEIIGE